MDETPTTVEGHTRVPNVFLDQWMPILIPSIVVLFLFIFRRCANTSQGRRNGGYSISLAQFCAPTEKAAAGFLEGGTGLSRSTVKEGLRSLVVDYELIGREPGKGTSAPFYYLVPIPEAVPNKVTIINRRKAASGLKSDTVASPESGLNSNPQRVENQPASGLKSDTVLLKEERTHERTLGKTQQQRPASVAVAVRPREAAFSDCSALFDPWFDGEWTPRFGSHHRADALEVWPKVVTLGNMNDLIEATRSYVKSRNPESTEYILHPHTFLTKFGKNQFKDRWKPFSRTLTKQERVRAETIAIAKHLRL